ncbi:MAG: hydroxymethylbilane synthase [Alphaproteobacteria bacterium]|nr:hydroxymethylbilane synthase [Alphaproteobacteria bacterium]
MTQPFLRIGARGSPLSLAQTRWLRDRMAEAFGLDDPETALPIIEITTTGDRIADRALGDAGGKGLFTKELDEALLDGRIDCAIHSLKDLPTQLPEGIALAATPEREDPRDAFISRGPKSLMLLPPGAVVGTASLRRQAQTLHARPNLSVTLLRGNVGTRLEKVQRGAVDATFLALAGLKRLNLAHLATSITPVEDMLPAACQGALAITARTSDIEKFAAVDHRDTRIAIAAERAFLEGLDGSCRTPIAALARVEGDRLRFHGEMLTPDGAQRWRRDADNALGDDAAAAARALGLAMAQAIRDEAGDALRLSD